MQSKYFCLRLHGLYQLNLADKNKKTGRKIVINSSNREFVEMQENCIREAKFENAVLFLRLVLPSTLIRPENGDFRKRSSNRRNLKTPRFRFSVDGKHFENKAFRKR